MKKWIGCLLILQLCAWEDVTEEPSFEETPLLLFVSLGSHCEPAVLLRHENLRPIAFPFDWLVTIDCEGLVKLLKDDFCDLFNPAYLFAHPEHDDCIEHSLYQIEFKHEGAFLQTTEGWNKTVEKYQRRIERFRSLRGFPGKVFFIRSAYDLPEGGPTWWLQQSFLDSKQAKNLAEALHSYFPKLDFTLILVNYLEDCPVPIGDEEKWLEYKIKKGQKQAEYKTLFSLFKMNPS